MFVHNVYFWLDDISDEERKRFEEGLRALPGINFVQEGFIGTPAGTDRDVVDNSYDYNLILYFEDETDQESYQEHPIHQEFVDHCEPYWKKVVVYDAVEEK